MSISLLISRTAEYLESEYDLQVIPYDETHYELRDEVGTPIFKLLEDKDPESDQKGIYFSCEVSLLPDTAIDFFNIIKKLVPNIKLYHSFYISHNSGITFFGAEAITNYYDELKGIFLEEIKQETEEKDIKENSSKTDEITYVHREPIFAASHPESSREFKRYMSWVKLRQNSY